MNPCYRNFSHRDHVAQVLGYRKILRLSDILAFSILFSCTSLLAFAVSTFIPQFDANFFLMVDTKPIEELIQDLEGVSAQNVDDLNIPQLLNQLESCDKIMNLLDEKASTLLLKMDEILADSQTEEELPDLEK